MDFERIKELIELVARSRIGELEVTEDGITVRIGRTKVLPDSTSGANSRDSVAPGMVPSKPIERNAAERGPGSNEIAAPLFGLVHLKPAPGAQPFVAVGDRVLEGQTVCLIEAMKVFTPVQSDQAGTIAEILVEAGQEVDVGQLLLRFSGPRDRAK